MKSLALLALPALIAAFPAHALDAACEPFIAAAEKTAQQSSRHSVTELSGGMRMEAIVTGGKFYSMSDGKWRHVKMDLLAAERELNAEVRRSKIKLSDCKKLGAESVAGIDTTVMTYTMTMPGFPAATSKVYIGKDGLVYAQSSEGVKVRYRYTSVAAPKL